MCAVEYDLSCDFKEVRDVLITEVLTEEDLEDGLEAEELELKVAITNHAYQRMNNTEGRDCEWSLVEDLIVGKGHVLFDVKSGEEFILMNYNQTLALVCEMHVQNGVAVLILITVIRKVYVDKQHREHEKKVYVSQTQKVY